MFSIFLATSPSFNLVAVFCVQSFQKMFGEEVLERVNIEGPQHPSVQKPETTETASVILEAKGTVEKKSLCVFV